MNSYLITYQAYNEELSTFTTIIEAESYISAGKLFKQSNSPAIMLEIKVLPNDNCEKVKTNRDIYPQLVDLRLVVNNDQSAEDLARKIAVQLGIKYQADPFGQQECVFVTGSKKEHNKPS